MSMRKKAQAGRSLSVLFRCAVFIIVTIPFQNAFGQPKPEIVRFEPFIWPSVPPADCPFERSKALTGIRFLGIKSGFRYADTWYPTWASDDKLYSPWTDGRCWRLDGSLESSDSGKGKGEFAETGQAVIEGSDPLDLKVFSLGIRLASALPYRGRYPCGSLVHKGVWYYGTYCLDPAGSAPSKFISADGRTMWLLYSANFAADWNGQKIGLNPPGGHYGLVLQKIELLGPR